MKLAAAVCVTTFANAIIGAPTQPHGSKDVGTSDSHGPWKPNPNGYRYGPSEGPKYHGRPSGTGKPSAGLGVNPTAGAIPSGRPVNNVGASNGVYGSPTSTTVAGKSTPAGGISATPPADSESASATTASTPATSNTRLTTGKLLPTVSELTGYPAVPIATAAQPSDASSVVVSVSPNPSASQAVGGGKPSGFQLFASGGHFQPSGVAYGTGAKPRPSGHVGQQGGRHGKEHANSKGPQKSGGFGWGGRNGKNQGGNSTTGWWV
ncbi:hypothetical protein E8E13_007362 [Curvularia kusanoi]|uniref:Uncharacterized protein n=1 Tax=Curvularia kusanoi TaxID=90978 RepID=A0A9P4TBT2_CURKU|nr:hypothetical protein E8E13_007362 [Curvularia kusanoi]